MDFDTTSTKTLDDQNGRSMIQIPKEEIVTCFIHSMVANLQCLGEEEDPSVFILPRFCRLHKVSHLEFECSHFQEAIAKVLTQIMEINSANVPKKISTQNQSSTNISESMEKVGEEIEDLNASCSDNYSNGGGLSY